MHKRKRYSSDLTDQEWDVISDIVPQPKSGGRPAKYLRREVVNAILYVVRAGCAWRLMPHDLPSWRVAYHYFSEWRRDGTWKRIHDKLRGDVREAAGRKREPSAGVIDSQSVKTTEKGGPMGTTRARRSTAASGTSSSTRSGLS
jgi:transposase